MVGVESPSGICMRMARHNQRALWYSNPCGDNSAYVRDDDGNIIYQDIDGEQVPLSYGGQTEEYETPVRFYGTIQNAGGVAEAAAYGVNVGSYQAKLIDVVSDLPIKEMTQIYLHEPTGECGDEAEYRVVTCPLALNQVSYLLKRNA